MVPQGIDILLKPFGLASNYLEISGNRIHFVEKGKGPLLLLLHGYESSLYTWRYNIENLSQKFKVIALDLPGFGCTSIPSGFTFSLENYARLIKCFLETLGYTELTLFGHSLGGSICLAFCQKYREMVKGVVLEATPPPDGSVISQRALSNILLYYYHDKSFLDNSLFLAIKEFCASEIKPPPLQFILSSSNKLDFSEKLTLPCLILWGRDDLILPFERNIETLSHFFSSCKKILFSDCGHAPHEEKQEKTDKAVLSNFINH